MNPNDLYLLLLSDSVGLVNKAIEELRLLPVTEAIAIFERLSNEKESNFRCRAVHRLSLISPKQAEVMALRLLSDSDAAVRWTSCETLWKLGSKKAVSKIGELLVTDPNELVRSFAAFSLGELGDETVIPLLNQAMQNDTGVDHEGVAIRETAKKAIQSIRLRTTN